MTEDDERMNRRTFLKVGAATGATLAGLGGAATPVAASVYPDDVFDEHQPEHVSISYDDKKDEIEEHQPYIYTDHLDIEPEVCYAAYYESNEWSTDAILYMNYYPTQRGYAPQDSHFIDREPVIVYINSDGSVDGIAYSGWHYLIARTGNPPLHEDTHPRLMVEPPHNHYYIDEDEDDGTFYDIEDFQEIIQSWYDNQWSADPDIMMEPWLAQDRSAFWMDGTEQFGPITWNWTETRQRWALRAINLNPFRDVNTDVEL